MYASMSHETRRPGGGSDDAPEHRLGEIIEHAAHLLPAQGPITVFIHHNTLHAFEDLPFHEAVKKGGQVFGCHPYLTEDRYRDELLRGRIRFSELKETVAADLGDRANEPVPCFGTRLDLRMAMLEYPLRFGPTDELIWYVAETDALRRVREEASAAERARLIAETRRWVLRDLRGGNEGRHSQGDAADPAARPVSPALLELLDRFGVGRIESWSEAEWERFTLQALWRVCCDGVRELAPFTPLPVANVRHRDLLLEATAVDADRLVNDLLIRFCASYLDQGMAAWPLPNRDAGFLRCFCAMYGTPGGSPAAWMRALGRDLARIERRGITALESIRESLNDLGVSEDEWEPYISATLLALRGWGGMIRQIAERGDRVVKPIAESSLVEFLAVRLIADRHALTKTAAEAMGYSGRLNELRLVASARVESHWPPSVEQRAFQVFQLAQIVGLSPEELHHLNHEEWTSLLREIETFGVLERRRVFHIAYEKRFTTQALDAVAIHAAKTNGRPMSPRFQASFCLDEREESLRRHLEEIAGDEVETFGVAGFYAVAMYYRGAADAHFTPLCPVVIRPGHWIIEEVEVDLDTVHRRRAKTRKVLGRFSHGFHLGTRTFALGAVLSGAVGVLASFPLVARILFPRVTAQLRKRVGRIVQTPPATRLRIERRDPEPGPRKGHVGFALDEMTDNGERFLRDIGLTNGFARIVLLHGHGSSSLNNPHNSAYNCGACGGAAGGPNARAMAQILNDPRVRRGLAQRGLEADHDTVFVGGYHNTCNDTVVYYDLEAIPRTHREEFAYAQSKIEEALGRNAHERCRRFLSAPLTLDFEEARQHVEERSEDLAQTRPEAGHATNAITIVGRRDWSRGLFLDRRAFLTSYDPSQDDAECSILTRILGAVFPVCSGINLEYYFSYVDNVGFGAGTKLPHNLASLLGVMDGAAGDLRTGLPWQMVEIHEPVRSLFIIETTPEAMTRIMERNAPIGKLCHKGWVLLALIDPETREISLFEDGRFRRYRPQAPQLPKATNSTDWYRGWRDHLEFAEIGA